VAFRVPGEPVTQARHHETLAVFHVWAVDRLLAAGLSDTAVLWHPLTDERSPLTWWDLGTLRSSARTRAVRAVDVGGVVGAGADGARPARRGLTPRPARHGQTASETGRVITAVVPSPTVLSSSSVPPICSTYERDIVSPMPMPDSPVWSSPRRTNDPKA
jgi:hypothetical protein